MAVEENGKPCVPTGGREIVGDGVSAVAELGRSPATRVSNAKPRYAMRLARKFPIAPKLYMVPPDLTFDIPFLRIAHE
jgi:hypothetical protein